MFKNFNHFWVKRNNRIVINMMILAVVDSSLELVDNRNRATCDNQGFCSPHVSTWNAVILLVLDYSRNSFGHLSRTDNHDVLGNNLFKIWQGDQIKSNC